MPVFTHKISDLNTLCRLAMLTRLSLGATSLLFAKTVEKQIMVRLIKSITKGKRNIKRSIANLRELNPMPRDLNLGYSTWLSLPSWAMKTVVPFLGGDHVVFLHTLIGCGKTRCQPNNHGLRLEVVSHVGKGMALVHVNNVVPCKSQAHLLIESIYTT